ncbi:MAG: metal ABC transporter substrate-binding protein [Anaerolineae bacterium]
MHRIISLMMLCALLLVPIANAQEDDRLQIVASHSILGDVVQQVSGDLADVRVTMPAGADPHTFQPVPSDLTTIADADVVFINGAFFEEGLLEAIENASTDMNIVAVSSCVEIISFSDHDHDEDAHDDDHDDHEHDEDAHDDDHDDSMSALCEQHINEMHALHDDDHAHEDEGDHAHEDDDDHDHSEYEVLGRLYALDCGDGHNDDEADEGDEEHAHGMCDPHVWMEPHNVMYWTMLIRDTLSELDPANAAQYADNASRYLAELDTFSHDVMRPMLESVPVDSRVLITSHDSLGYLAANYDFEIITTIIGGGSTVAEPSAAAIAGVIDLIREEGVSAIFGETTVRDTLASQIADETGAELFVLYSGSLSDEAGPASTYLDYMRYNVSTIVEALGGME